MASNTRDPGIAVPDSRRLNVCYDELVDLITARPPIEGDESLWWSNRRISEGKGAALSEESLDWLHRYRSRDVADKILLAAIRDKGLPLWVWDSSGEAKVDAFALIELDLRNHAHTTFAAGAYTPGYVDFDNALSGRPLWTKIDDWRAFVAATLQDRYGEGNAANQPSDEYCAAKITTGRAPSVKAGRPPSNEEILAKAEEMKARGLNGRTIASQMRLEPGFENVATTAVRDLIKGRWKPAGRPKKAA